MPTANAVAAQATGNALATTIQVGEVQVAAGLATGTGSAAAAAVAVGEVQVSVSAPAQATASTSAPSVAAGAVSVPAATPTATSAAPSPAVLAGPVQIAAAVAVGTAEALSPGVAPGPVQTNSAVAIATAEAFAPTVQPGEVFINAATSTGIIVGIGVTIVQGPPIPDVVISRLFVVASDVLKIEFTGNLSVDRYLLDPENYLVIPGGGIRVVGVVRPVGVATPSVILLVKGLLEGTTYTISFKPVTLRQTNSIPVEDLSWSWIHHKTKVDLTIGSISDSYDTRSRSTIRGLIEAIMISDEEIGGNF